MLPDSLTRGFRPKVENVIARGASKRLNQARWAVPNAKRHERDLARFECGRIIELQTNKIILLLQDDSNK